MKRILTIFATIALTASLSAQQYKMRITDRQGQQLTHENYVEFLENNMVSIPLYTWNDSINNYIYDPNIVPASELRLIDFRTMGNRTWEPNYAPSIINNSNRPDDFGYGSVMHMRDLMTEDMTCISSSYNWYRTALEADMQPVYITPHIVWFYYIDAIMQCNDIIRIIGDNPATDQDKAVLCEALITRAMLYLDFARMYEFLPNEMSSGITEMGTDVTALTVPIIDENTTAVNGAYYVPRATKEQVADFINKDLGRADAIVSIINTDSHEVPHADVICGLQARKAMWTGDYFIAYSYAKSAISLTDSRPMTADEMLSPKHGFNDISRWMWGVQQTSEKNCPSNLANFISWMSPEYEGYAELVPSMIGRSLYDRISDSDPRKLLFIAPYNSSLSGKTPLNYNIYYAPYTSVKFRPANGEYEWYNGACFTAYPLMRVEEMYFIQAEALAYSDPASALELLNTFMRQYRDSTYSFSSTDRDELINEIILQKRIEFWGEGQTFFDVKRLNMSVTRDYEGTNFYAKSAYNTTGRPWWMNITIPDGASTSNLALYGYGNPQNNEEELRIWETLRFLRPAFLNDFTALPIDSVSQVLLHLSVPEELRSLTGSIDLSLSANFPLGQTVKLNSVSTSDEEITDLKISSSSLYSSIKSIASVNNMPTTGHTNCYLRVRVGNALSSILVLPVLMPETFNYNKNHHFSYLPRITATTVGTIDCEAVAADDSVKVVNISLQGEGDYYYTYGDIVGALYFNDSRCNFTINPNGTTDNTFNDFNYRTYDIYDFILGRIAPSHTFTDGNVSINVQRNDLIGYAVSNTIDVSLLFNRQQIAENQYSWRNYTKDVFFSEFKLELNVPEVTIEKAETNEVQLYRIVEPYQRNHNIMFTVKDSATIEVARQMAFHDNTSGSVYVSGSGQITADGVYKFTLQFVDSVGNIIATCNEQIGEVITWQTIGTGTIQENFWYEATGAVEIQVCEQNPKCFRILKPFDSLNAAIDYTTDGSQSPYMDITILKPDQTFNGVYITQPDLVYFTLSNTGYFYTIYMQYVRLIHTTDYFANPTLEHFLHSHVLSYQPDGHTPSQIQLAPIYQLEGIGVWNQSNSDDILIITFPDIQ